MYYYNQKLSAATNEYALNYAIVIGCSVIIWGTTFFKVEKVTVMLFISEIL